MAFVTHEQAIERTLVLVEGERGETATHLVLLVATRVLAAEVRRLREMEARLRTTATRPQGHGEKTADYRQARRLAHFFLGEA